MSEPAARAELKRIAKRGFVVHESLMAFLVREHPTEHPLAIVSACSYEIGRVIGTLTEGLSAPEREEMFEGVIAIFREHMDAYHRGLKR